MVEKTFKNGGYDVAYIHDAPSSAQQTLVFLPGYLSDKHGTKATYFRKLCQENNIAFMALDYKGHGASGGDFKDFTLSDWLEDVLLLLKKINGPYVLMGSSLGGWLAMLAASNVNVKAKALFLLAPAPDFTERILSTLSPVQKKHLNDKDLIEIGEGPLPFTKKLLENGKKYSFLGKGLTLNCPVYAFYGKKDLSVQWQESFDLAKALTVPLFSLTFLADADHGLSRPQDLKVLTNSLQECFPH